MAVHLFIFREKREKKEHIKEALAGFSSPPILFQGENFSLEEFIQEAETLGFLSERKLIVLEEIDLLPKETLDKLKKVFPLEGVDFLFTASNLPPSHWLVKQADQVVREKIEKPWEKERRLAEWLVHKAASQGVVLREPIASALVKGVDANGLLSELEKLICFVGERREITLDDLRKIAISTPHETLWQFGDAILSRQTTEALKIGKILLEGEGGSIFSLLAQLRTQFQTARKTLSAFAEGGREEVTRLYPYLKGGLLEKKLSLFQKYGPARLAKALILLFETEVEAKNSHLDPLVLLEILTVKMTHDSLSSPQFARI
ncbi:MAG: hypothetical protein K940chlam9_00984 [Chlamydiae bacterium]|nr:hypothetical protein [Chlamydiota bacterium]